MTANNNKPASRKRSSPSSTQKKRGPGLKRWLLGAATAALASFQIASCSLDPGWNDRLLNPPKLSTLSIPGLEQWRDPPASSAPSGSLATSFSQCRDFFPGGEPPAL